MSANDDRNRRLSRGDVSYRIALARVEHSRLPAIRTSLSAITIPSRGSSSWTGRCRFVLPASMT